MDNEITTGRVENALILLWAVHYEDADLKEWYEDGMKFYKLLIEKRSK